MDGGRQSATVDLVGELVLLLVVKRQLIVQHVVEIFLHEDHRVGKTVFLVVSAVVHVGVVTKTFSRNIMTPQ